MKNLARLAALAAALAVAAPAAAQQRTASPSQARVGIGLGMNVEQISPSLSAGVFTAPQIYVPIAVAPNLRIEPQFGWTSIDDDATDTTDRWFTLGVGGFYVMPAVQQTQLYVGGRLAFTWVRDENRTGAGLEKTTFRDTRIAAVLGGEYLPSPRFSVGAEGQLGYTWLGDPETKLGGVTTTGQGGSLKDTQGVLFIRIYFL